MKKRNRSFGEYAGLLKEKGLSVRARGAADGVDPEIKYVSYDSKDVKTGTLFICKGAHFRREYLDEAIKRGAVACLFEEGFLEEEPENIAFMAVNDVRKAMSLAVDMYFGGAESELKIVGLTGTKGKSTTLYMLKAILEDFLDDIKEPRPAILSSIESYDGLVREEAHLTTPEPIELYRHMDNARSMGIEYLLMEVSSQALKYERVSCLRFESCAFLNIGEDHISEAEHSDFEDYFGSKLKIFGQSETACINAESALSERIFGAAREAGCKIISFGKSEGADIYGYDIRAGKRYIRFKVKSESFDREFKLGMRGLFNVDNALAAIALAYSLNIPLEYMESGLKRCEAPGRMEVFTEGGKTAVVDYAHNALSFETLFKSVREEYPEAEISIVFGCPGGKAFNRRRELGRLAARYADRIYLTEEDAGEEDLISICREIAKSAAAENPKKPCEIIPSREAAVRRAIENAAQGGVVLVTGKGRETRQKRGAEYVETDSDVEFVYRAFRGK